MNIIRTRAAIATSILGLTLALAPVVSAPAAETPHGAPKVQPRERVGARAVVLPPISQAGKKPAKAKSKPLLAVEFKPAQPGRPVVVQRKRDGAWTDWRRETEDRAGQVVVMAHPGLRVRAIATGRGPIVRSNIVTVKHRKLLFDEAFDGSSLGGQWRADLAAPVDPVFKALTDCPQDNAAMRRIGGGVMRMTPPDLGDPSPCPDAGSREFPLPLLGTHVSTDGAFGFRYGTAGARMKLPRHQGAATRFLLDATGKVPGDPSRGAQVVIADWKGAGERNASNGRVSSRIWEFDDFGGDLLHESADRQKSERLRTKGTWWDVFHVFSVEWTPKEYIFRIDGREVWRTSEAVSHKAEHLALTFLGSTYEYPWADESAEVDWVRVWGLK